MWIKPKNSKQKSKQQTQNKGKETRDIKSEDSK